MIDYQRQFRSSQDDELLVFQLEKNKRYRFRLAHSGGDVKCPISGIIDGHQLLVISLDGNPIEPVNTSQIILVPGKHYILSYFSVLLPLNQN